MACISCQKRKEAEAKRRQLYLDTKARKAETVDLSSDSSPDLYASSKSIPDIGLTEPVILNWAYRPPAGGWSVDLRIGGQRRRFSGSPTSMVNEISSAYEAAGRKVSTQKIWDYLNSVWAARDPNRIIRKAQKKVAEAETDPNAHLQASPMSYGPRVWGMLSLFGVKGHFDHDAWMSAIAFVSKILDPAGSPGGCDECHETWTKWKIANNPFDVTNEHEAADWVWRLHNEVNKKLGKPRLNFAQAVRANQWAFEIIEDQTVPI